MSLIKGSTATLSFDNQWAFRPGHSCRDVTTMSVCKWILAFHHRRKVGVYLSDISGAFDRVRTDLLLAKCRAVGMTDVWILFLTSYLQPRRAVVLVDGSRSSEFILQNMVFQGTVLGPTLWNVFFRRLSPSHRSQRCGWIKICGWHDGDQRIWVECSTRFALYPIASHTDCRSWVGQAQPNDFDNAKEESCITPGVWSRWCIPISWSMDWSQVDNGCCSEEAVVQSQTQVRVTLAVALVLFEEGNVRTVQDARVAVARVCRWRHLSCRKFIVRSARSRAAQILQRYGHVGYSSFHWI